MSLIPDDGNWHWHECPHCSSIMPGGVRRRNKVIGPVRPVLIVFLQTRDPEIYSLLFADLNQLPFEVDDAASECGGALPKPWVWEDVTPQLAALMRGSSSLRKDQ